MLAVTSQGNAQYLPTGIVNSPPTVVHNGDTMLSDTTLNVFEGGVVGPNVNAGHPNGTSTNVVVNIGGGTVGNDFVGNIGSVVNISGGTIGTGAEFFGALNVSGGTIGSGVTARPGSSVSISGGTLLRTFDVFSQDVTISGGSLHTVRVFPGGKTRFSGGTVEERFVADNGTAIDIAGGQFLGLFQVSQSNATISGGTFGARLSVGPLSTVLLVGKEFYIDGVVVPASASAPTLISSRSSSSILSGLLADGTPFNFALNPSSLTAGDYFAANANLLVQLVPEPCAAALLLLGSGISSLPTRRC